MNSWTNLKDLHFLDYSNIYIISLSILFMALKEIYVVKGS